MLKPGGYAYIFDPCGGMQEWDTITCNHCNSVVKMDRSKPPEELGGMCRNCMKPICKLCLDKGCTPFEKKLEMIEDRDRVLRSYGM